MEICFFALYKPFVSRSDRGGVLSGDVRGVDGEWKRPLLAETLGVDAPESQQSMESTVDEDMDRGFEVLFEFLIGSGILDASALASS